MKFEDIYQFFENPPPTYLCPELAVCYVVSILLEGESYGTQLIQRLETEYPNYRLSDTVLLAAIKFLEDQETALIGYFKKLEKRERPRRMYLIVPEWFNQAQDLARLWLEYINRRHTQKKSDYALSFFKLNDEILQHYKQALSYYHEAHNQRGEAIASKAIGDILHILKLHKEALQYYDQALFLCHQMGNRVREAISLYDLGNTYYSLENYQEAIDYYQQSLEISQQIGNRSFESMSLSKLVDIYSYLEDNQQVIDYAQLALNIAIDVSDFYLQASINHKLGIFKQKIQEIQEAQSYYQTAIEIFTKIGDSRGRAMSLGKLGSTYYTLGKYQQSIEIYQQTLKISRKIHDYNIEAESLDKLSNAFYFLGQFHTAIDFNQQKLEIVRHIGERYEEAKTLIDISNIYCSLGQYQEALELISQSLLIVEAIDSEPHRILLLSSAVKFLLLTNSFQDAITVAQAIPDINNRLEALKTVIEYVSASGDNIVHELLTQLHKNNDEQVYQQLFNTFQRYANNHRILPIKITRNEALQRIKFIQGNIFDLEVDVLVHPTGPNLDFTGVIGRQIYEIFGHEKIEIISNKSSETALGKVVVSSADRLRANYLLHMPVRDVHTYPPTVVTISHGINAALNKAEELDNVKTIAFPSVGSGTAGLNADDVALEALNTVANYLENGSRLESVIFAFNSEIGYQAYVSAYQQLILQTAIVYYVSLSKSSNNVNFGGLCEISLNLSLSEISSNNIYQLQLRRDEAIANELNIILNAPGFQLNGDNTSSLPLDPDIAQETQTAHFHLTALHPGNTTITAELYRGDIFETKLETQIQVADIDEATFTPQRITTQPRPVPRPDFILRIQTIWNETNSSCKFQYQLKSFRFPSVFPGNNIYTSESLSSSWIEQVRGLLATTLENISGSLPTEGKSRLISLGQYLFGHFIPTELQTDFRSLIPQNSTFTLLILADQEAWIPWELLYDGQRFFADRFIIGRWLQELNNTRPYEFPVGAVNVAHYANVEQPQLWATLLEAPGAPPPQPLPEGVLHDSTEAIRGLHLIRYSQSSDAANLRNAPVTLDNSNDTEDIELQMRPAKLNLRRNRPFVTLSYVKIDTPELTALENTWASAFIRAGCSGFTGSLWAVESSVETAFISCFYNRLWAGASLGEAFYTSRQLARAAAPDSLDWLAYVLFGDPMARPYRPVPGDGYAIVEPIGREIDDPLPPGTSARFRVTLRRNPPVWHEDRVIEVAENLVFENLQVHIVTYGLQVIPDLPVTMTLTAKGDYLGWFTLVVPNEITETSALVQVYFADGVRSIHSLTFSLKIENGREE